MDSVACMTKTSSPGKENKLLDNTGTDRFDVTLKQVLTDDDMSNCENFIKLISLCELIQGDMKEGDLLKVMEVIDNYFSKYKKLEVVHTGSAVEGLFVPLLYNYSFNMDIDHMIVRKDIKVYPNLPLEGTTSKESHSRKFLLVEADHPGYVFMVDMTDNIPEKPHKGMPVGEYSMKTSKFIEDSQSQYPPLLTGSMERGSLTGPSILQIGGGIITSTQYGESCSLFISRDIVFCLDLSWWPEVAEEWIERPRTSGWPDRETVASIVKSGCNVVPVGYYNSPLKEKEWRLSFSKAERFLVMSLSRKQKQVCSILKYIIKRSKCSEVVSSYHLKTCLLWLCETVELQIWESNPITLLMAKLLSILSQFYSEHNLPNYFVRQNNMIDHIDSDTIKSTAAEIKNISTNFMSHLAQFIDQRFSVPVVFGSFQSCLSTKYKLDLCFKYNFFAISIYIYFHHSGCTQVHLSSKQYICYALDLHKSKDERSVSETNPSYLEMMDLLQKCLQDDSQEGDMTEEEISSIILGIFTVITMIILHKDFNQHTEALQCLQILANLNETCNGDFIENYNKRRQPNQAYLNLESEEPSEAENFKRLIMVVMIRVFIERTKLLRASAIRKASAVCDTDAWSHIHFSNLGIVLLHSSKEEAFIILKFSVFLDGTDLTKYMCSLEKEVKDKHVSVNLLELMLEKQEIKLEDSFKETLQERLTKLKLGQ